MRTAHRVHLLGGQKIKWALDEDLLWARRALDGAARLTALPFSGIVHAAWWPAVLAAGPAALRDRFVVCFADNPPSFYLTRPGFREAAGRVNLWVARTGEAREQFEILRLPVAVAPYCADPGIFRPLGDDALIRRELGIPDGAFVIGNFHRDSEGADLTRPKKQKGPDLFLQIARELKPRVPRLVVLLAGPRRHWLRRALADEGIPTVFHGRDTGEDDDFGVNILSREMLNRLYQALDVCVISSRWEGGPYSVLEALFAGRPVISTPVGTARDVLDPCAIFESPGAAANLLATHCQSGSLWPSARASRDRVLTSHSADALKLALQKIYASIPAQNPSPAQAVRSFVGSLTRRWGGGFQPASGFGEFPRSSEDGFVFWPAPGVPGSTDRLAACASSIADCSNP